MDVLVANLATNLCCVSLLIGAGFLFGHWLHVREMSQPPKRPEKPSNDDMIKLIFYAIRHEND